MAQTTLSVRVDNEAKKKFDKFCSNVGMNPSVAVNMFVKFVINERRLPFRVKDSSDPFYSESNLKRLYKSIDNADKGKLTEHELTEV